MEQQPEVLKKLEAKADRMRKSAFAPKRQPLSPFGSEYIGFNGRMWAATLDSLVFFVTVIPLSVWLTNLFVSPELNMTLMPLAVSLDGVADPLERGRIIREFLLNPQRLHYMTVNTLFQLGGMLVYCMWCWKNYGATLGKLLSKQKVVVLSTGAYPSYSQSFWRFIGYIVGSIPLFLGIIWISFDKKRQGWHDKLAGTVVISTKNMQLKADAVNTERTELQSETETI